MGMNKKEVGGGAAVGLSNDLISILQQAINTGSFGPAGRSTGAGALDNSGNMFSVLNNVLAGGAGPAGQSIQEMISRDIERQANALRARFNAGGGVAEGTPAAFGEALLRAEAAPRATQAVTEMQMSALMPLLQMISGLAQKGIPQRETVMQPSPLAQGVGMFAPIAAAALPFFGPMGMAAGAGSTLFNPNAPWSNSPFYLGG